MQQNGLHKPDVVKLHDNGDMSPTGRAPIYLAQPEQDYGIQMG